MALNPFFLQGSSNEQYLIQDLINEQLKIYGIDVYYIPRKFIRTDDIFKEVETSKFDDNYVIEAYLKSLQAAFGQYECEWFGGKPSIDGLERFCPDQTRLMILSNPLPRAKMEPFRRARFERPKSVRKISKIENRLLGKKRLKSDREEKKVLTHPLIWI